MDGNIIKEYDVMLARLWDIIHKIHHRSRRRRHHHRRRHHRQYSGPP